MVGWLGIGSRLVRAGVARYRASTEKVAWVCDYGYPHAGFRHRRHNGDLFDHRGCVAASAAVCRSGAAGGAGRYCAGYQYGQQWPYRRNHAADSTYEGETKGFAALGGFEQAGYEFSDAGEPAEIRAARVTASIFPL